ncbi:hypothetical protein Y015_01470 [Chlamydia muridarum str. Nigg CM972]|nr:hypothetical protein TAC_01470 [Chlamydia muridarum str. Nigg3 CMUT3-5]AHH23595.1 hypothetical protein Y015_01470 [Chlamydia muridarum str. Nigg CM972]
MAKYFMERTDLTTDDRETCVVYILQRMQIVFDLESQI